MKKSTIHGTFAVSFTFAHSNAVFVNTRDKNSPEKLFIIQKRASVTVHAVSLELCSAACSRAAKEHLRWCAMT